MSGAAGLTARSPLPAWGRVLIILLNSDEILKRSPLGSHPRQMKQRRTQLARGDAHVFLHLFRIFQFESQRAEAGIKEEDAETEGGGRGRGHRAKSRVTNGAVPVRLGPGAHRPRARQTPRCSLMSRSGREAEPGIVHVACSGVRGAPTCSRQTAGPVRPPWVQRVNYPARGGCR